MLNLAVAMNGETDEIDRSKVAELIAALMPPRKPAGLALAERSLKVLREEYAAAQEKLRDAIARRMAPGTAGTTSDTEVKAASAALTEIETRVASAAKDLDLAREKHAPAFLDTLSIEAAKARFVLLEMIDDVEAVLLPLVDLDHYGAANRLPVPRTVGAAREVHASLRRMRALLGKAGA